MIRKMHHSDAFETELDTLAGKGQWQEVASLLHNKAPQWMDSGKDPYLEKWLQRLPEDFVSASPWMLFWSGIVRLAVRPREGTEYFEQAYKLFKQKHHIPGQFAAWSGVVDSILYTWDDFTPLNEWIARFESIKRYYARQAQNRSATLYGGKVLRWERAIVT
jgi:hypothetical protein